MLKTRVIPVAAAVLAPMLFASGNWLIGSSDEGGEPSVHVNQAGASPSGPSLPSSLPSGSPSGSRRNAPMSPAEREAADRAAVEVAWASFWTVHLNLEGAYPPAQWHARGAEVAVDPIKAQVLRTSAADLRDGVVGYGAVVPRPYWQQPIAGKTSAVMRDCQDASRAGSMIQKTGQKLTVGVARSNIRAHFVKGGDGKWRVRQIEYLLDEGC